MRLALDCSFAVKRQLRYMSQMHIADLEQW